ncbi:small ribosomal subunit protein mS39-like [Amphiura filiformis]|uniref:small ribosomal subunit protein mS39-like n=1 Tax=Amphiura filiformis TaxID=82378 RepID=UPI003B21D082
MAASMASCQACRTCLFARNLQRFPNTRFVHKTSPACLGGQATAPNDTIIIPTRKPRDAYAVLQALGNTVGKDPTGQPYIYHDDPHLAPRSMRERRDYRRSLESGRKAAQFVIQKNPKLFLSYQHDEPKIESLYPPLPEYAMKDPGDEAIMERVDENDIKGAWEMYQSTVQAGQEVSLETSNALLDMLCFHGNQARPSLVELVDKSIATAQELQAALKDDTQEEELDEDAIKGEAEEAESVSGQKSDAKDKRKKRKQDQFEVTWIDGNEAEQLFEAIKEKNAPSYSALIQGMVKHNAHVKAFNMYNEMQQKKYIPDVRAYNALIEAVPFIRDNPEDVWQVLEQLLKQMSKEDIQPTLYTFNAVMRVLTKNRDVGRFYGMQVINEMKAIGIEPSLGTYASLLNIHVNPKYPVKQANVLYDILDDLEDQEFVLRHPRDEFFFFEAMCVCSNAKDLELAYKLDALLNTGSNSMLLGGMSFQNMYYSRFFNLITQFESVDAMLEYYEQLVPQALLPFSTMYIDILQSIESAGAYHKIPRIWQDAANYGRKFDENLLDTLLKIMAMSTVDKQLHEEFCSIVTDTMKIARQPDQQRGSNRMRGRPPRSIRVTQKMLNNMVVTYLKGEQLDEARKVLDYSKKAKITPSNIVLEDFLSTCIQVGDKQMALGCIEVAVHHMMTGSSTMADRIKEEMVLNNEERKHLDYILQERQ